MTELPWKGNIESMTATNKWYRRIVHTNSRMQVVLMSLSPNQEIGEEIHYYVSQFIRVEEGSGRAVIGSSFYWLKPGDAFVIPPSTKHNVIAGEKGLKLYTVYTKQMHEVDEKKKPVSEASL